ncbi:hypothetical protein V2J09_017069 [Rumex salicifolius]
MTADTTIPMSSPTSADQIPDCYYPNDAVLIKPDKPTPSHILQLSNLDSQKFLRFSIKYLYLFVNAVPVDSLKTSLSAALSHYYPLAGRLRAVRSSPLETDAADDDDDHSRLEVDCNGEGAVFAEAFMDYTAGEFLASSAKPNPSWRKLLFRVPVKSFLDVPPLVVQVTKLGCGGMILCTAINHSVCDGVGTSQFLNAWAHLTTKPNSDPPIPPFHFRHVFDPRCPPQVTFTHQGFTRSDNTHQFLQSNPLVPTSFTFHPSHLLSLKKHCSPSTKCTSFEALASHTWRSWVRSFSHLSPTVHVKLLFSVNVRKKMKPRGLPEGYYGNGFVLGCAETTVRDLVTEKLRYSIGLIQQAKMDITDEYVRSMVDLLEDKTVRTDLSTTFVISQWSRLGLEEVDFGQGKPLHMGSLTSDVYCLFLPVIGHPNSVRVSVSVPCSMVDRFESYMTQFDGDEIEDLDLDYYECISEIGELY